MNDDPKLRALLAKLERAASGRLAAELRTALAEQTRQELTRSFVDARAPDGRAWAPLRTRAGRPLVETGALRDGFDVRQTQGGVSITNDAPYAAAHHHGFRIRRRRRTTAARKRSRRFGAGAAVVPARPMVPTSHWGPSATRRLRVAANGVVRVFMRK